MEKKIFKKLIMTQIASAVALTLCMVIDGVIIGRFLGVDAMSAYGLTSPIITAFAAIGGMLSAGVQILCSRAMGRGDEKELSKVFSVAVVVVLILSSVCMIGVITFAEQISVALGAGQGTQIGSMTSDYLIGYIIGCPAFIGMQLLIPFLQLAGDRKRIIYGIIAMMVGDIVMDLLVVLVFGSGTFGMGLASSISYFLALIILFCHFIKKNCIFHFSLHSFSFSKIWGIFVLGFPYAVYQICRTLQTISLNRILIRTAGTDGVAMYSTIHTVLGITSAFGMGIAAATLTLSGVLFGEKDKKALQNLVKIFVRYSVLINSVLILIVWIFTKMIASTFLHGNEELITQTTLGLRIAVIYLLPFSINSSFRSFYQGTNKMKTTHMLCIFQNFVFIVFFAFVLSKGMDVLGVWIAFPLGELATLIVLTINSIVVKKKIPRCAEDFAMLGKDFGYKEENIWSKNVSTMNELSIATEEIQKFCISKGVTGGKQIGIPLCIDEMVSNTIKYGLVDLNGECVEIKLIYDEGNWIIRLRDSGKLFDPTNYIKLHNDEDKTAHIGIRLVSNLAKEVTYLSTFGLNNLYITL